MPKVTITTIQGAYASTTELNANFAALAAEFENAVSRDGTTPNSMDADLDMGGNDLINVGNITEFSNVYLAHPESTTAALEAIANAINTAAGKVAGASVFNTTTNKPVWAVGSADGDVWVDATGATEHTPA